MGALQAAVQLNLIPIKLVYHLFLLYHVILLRICQFELLNIYFYYNALRLVSSSKRSWSAEKILVFVITMHCVERRLLSSSKRREEIASGSLNLS